MAKIEFIPLDEKKHILVDPPLPMSKVIPEWYRNHKSKLVDNSSNLIFDYNNNVIGTNATVKRCMPFFDAMTAGYTWTLPCDVEFRKNEESVTYAWLANINILRHHADGQYPDSAITEDQNKFIFKWLFDYLVKTPKGYSTLFTHPMNRDDLPFITLSGIVDTDDHPVGINFPFKLKKFDKDSIIIPAGTPIVQMIPFKRESWKSYTRKFDINERIKSEFALGKNIIKSYKNNWWKRKEYK